MLLKTLKFGEGLCFCLEGRDGIDESRDGKRIADTAGPENQVQGALFARQTDGHPHQRGDAGTVDLRDVIEHHDDFANATAHHRIQSFVELLGGFANGQAPVHINDSDVTLLADVYFHGTVVRHFRVSLGSDLQETLPLGRDGLR